MGQFGIGQSVTRFEDRACCNGGGRYLDDVNLPGQVQPSAAALAARAAQRSASIDTARRRGRPACSPCSPEAISRSELGTMR